jgi:hypothetical protein
VRIGYDAGKPAQADVATFAALEADPAPAGTAQWVTESFAGTNVQVRAITGGHQLMHSKYLVRDAGTPGATVWTGSTNFTDDAWTQQENNVITIANGPLATAYRTDFDQLWAGGVIAGTGVHSAGTSTAGAGDLGWDFCPGDGPAVNLALAARVTAATRHLRRRPDGPDRGRLAGQPARHDTRRHLAEVLPAPGGQALRALPHQRAQLHAPEGPGQRRHAHHRQLQLLRERRAQRREPAPPHRPRHRRHHTDYLGQVIDAYR